MVLWLVIGMAMFRNEPISEVARRLNICADGLATEELLARSALSQARQRLGEEPMKWLFKQCSQVWGCERYPQDTWNDLQVFAIDGALFRTQDTPQLREHSKHRLPGPFVFDLYRRSGCGGYSHQPQRSHATSPGFFP